MADVAVSTTDPQADTDAQEIQMATPIEGLSDEEFMELADSTLVVVPHRGSINVGISRHFGMWAKIGLRWADIKDEHGGFIQTQRNAMAKWFLEFAHKNPQVKYCVMIDSDQTIQWDAPLRLSRHGKPIVSGIVCGYNKERGIFACFTAKDENGVARFPSFRDTRVLPASGLRQVEQVGTGLVCIRRDVLETIMDSEQEPFTIPEEYTRGGVIRKSEDVVFCERARRHGFKCYVDFSVHAGHYKTLMLAWPQEALDEQADAIQWQPSVFDYKGVV